MISGWITNKGKIVECEVYEHLNIDDETINEVWAKYADILDDIEKECETLIEEGEHPEWHTYEISESDFKFNAVNELYELGYLRITKYGDTMAVEGFGQYLEANKYILKELADKHDCKLQIFKK